MITPYRHDVYNVATDCLRLLSHRDEEIVEEEYVEEQPEAVPQEEEPQMPQEHPVDGAVVDTQPADAPATQDVAPAEKAPENDEPQRASNSRDRRQKDSRRHEERSFSGNKRASPASKVVILFEVPHKARLDDVQYYTERYGEVVEAKWFGRKHATVEFRRHRDAQNLVSDGRIDILKEAVSVDWYNPR